MAEEVIIKQEPEMVDVTTGGKVIEQITPDQLEATKIPALDTKPLDISGLVSGVKTDTAAITQEVLRRQKEQEEQAKKTISEETGITAPTAREQLIKFTGTRPVSEALTFRRTEEEARGVTELEEKVASQNIKVAQASENLTTLEAEKQSAIQNVETQPISRSFKEVQKKRIERDYNTKIAQATAKLSAESAMSEALSGNLTNARNLVNDAIEAYTYDINNEIDRFDSLKSTYSDWVDALDSDEKDALNLAYNELQNERDRITEEKQTVGSLMLEYPNAGITLDDDVDIATKKAGVRAGELEKIKLAQEAEEAGTLEETQLASLYMQANRLASDTGVSITEAIGDLPVSQDLKTSLLFMNEFALSTIEQETQTQLNRVNTEEITPEMLQDLYDKGFDLNEDLIPMAEDQETINRLRKANGELASIKRQKSMEEFTGGLRAGFEEIRKVPEEFEAPAITFLKDLFGE